MELLYKFGFKGPVINFIFLPNSAYSPVTVHSVCVLIKIRCLYTVLALWIVKGSGSQKLTWTWIMTLCAMYLVTSVWWSTWKKSNIVSCNIMLEICFSNYLVLYLIDFNITWQKYKRLGAWETMGVSQCQGRIINGCISRMPCHKIPLNDCSDVCAPLKSTNDQVLRSKNFQVCLCASSVFLKHPQSYAHLKGGTFSMMHTWTRARLLHYVFSEYKESCLDSHGCNLEGPVLPRMHPWHWDIPNKKQGQTGNQSRNQKTNTRLHTMTLKKGIYKHRQSWQNKMRQLK